MSASALPAPVIDLVPRLEPYLVEVIMPFPVGAADEAVTAAAEAVARLLDAADFTGTPTASTPDADDDSRRIATTAFVQALVRVVADQMIPTALSRLLTEPGVLAAYLPSSPPDAPGLPWLNDGILTVTRSA